MNALKNYVLTSIKWTMWKRNVNAPALSVFYPPVGSLIKYKQDTNENYYDSTNLLLWELIAPYDSVFYYNYADEPFIEYTETDNFKGKIITADIFNRYDYYGKTMTYDKVIIRMDGHDYIGPDHYV